MALIDLQNISKQYDTKVILKDANFTLNHGQRIAVIGQNGQGKSTLFKIIMKQTENKPATDPCVRENVRSCLR